MNEKIKENYRGYEIEYNQNMLGNTTRKTYWILKNSEYKKVEITIKESKKWIDDKILRGV